MDASFALLTFAIVALGCGSGAPETNATESAEPARPPSADAVDAGVVTPPPVLVGRGTRPPPRLEVDRPVRNADSSFRILRVVPWPGWGTQIVAEWEAGGTAIEPQVVVTAGGRSEHAAVRSTPAVAGITAIALVPGSGTAHAQRQQAARTLIAMLPPGERIALWVMEDDGLWLQAEVTEDRAHLARRIDAVAPVGQPADEGTVGAREVQAVRASLGSVEGPWGAASRFLVVIGGAEAPEAVGDHHAVATLWLGDALSDADEPAQGWSQRTPAGAARSLAERIARRRERIVTVGTCVAAEAGEPLQLRVGTPAGDGADAGGSAAPSAPFDVLAPAPIEHALDSECDAQAAAAHAYPFWRRIDLQLTAQQRAVYDARWQAKSEEDFEGTLRFDDAEPVEATLHFRGHTSLNCQRKSLSVDLKGGEVRRLSGSGSSDEFYLISLCKDDHYFRQLFGNRVASSLGLFPLDSHLLELTLNGVTQGVYLLLEKPTHGLRQDRIATSAIVRRRFDPGDAPAEVKFPKAEPERSEAQAAYDALAAMAQDGEPESLRRELAARMHLDGYLGLVAMNTVLINGDSVDEVFFYASPELGSQEQPYFRSMAWDLDDLGRACHHGGRHAFDRGDGLMYCVEADLDHALVRSDEVYARYVSVLRELLEGPLAFQVLSAELDAARDALLVRLQDDATCAAMYQLVARDERNARCSFMRDSISAAVEAYRSMLRDNHVRLAAAIETVSEPPP